MTTYDTRERGDHGPPSVRAILLGAQLRAGGEDCARAVAEIRQALATAEGNRVRAAWHLGVHVGSLRAWLRLPALQPCKAAFPAENARHLRRGPVDPMPDTA